jgi:hypothetical protein
MQHIKKVSRTGQQRKTRRRSILMHNADKKAGCNQGGMNSSGSCCVIFMLGDMVVPMLGKKLLNSFPIVWASVVWRLLTVVDSILFLFDGFLIASFNRSQFCWIFFMEFEVGCKVEIFAIPKNLFEHVAKFFVLIDVRRGGKVNGQFV